MLKCIDTIISNKIQHVYFIRLKSEIIIFKKDRIKACTGNWKQILYNDCVTLLRRYDSVPVFFYTYKILRPFYNIIDHIPSARDISHKNLLNCSHDLHSSSLSHQLFFLYIFASWPSFLHRLSAIWNKSTCNYWHQTITAK